LRPLALPDETIAHGLLTCVAEGGTRYEDTNGARGLLPASGIEWMRAGGGVCMAAAPVNRD